MPAARTLCSMLFGGRTFHISFEKNIFVMIQPAAAFIMKGHKPNHFSVNLIYQQMRALLDGLYRHNAKRGEKLFRTLPCFLGQIFGKQKKSPSQLCVF